MKLVTIEQVTSGNKTHIILFTRDGPTRQKTVISDFRPYFYVPYKEFPDYKIVPVIPQKILETDKNEINWMSPTGSKAGPELFKTLTGEIVAKYHTKTPGDVPHFRRMFSKTWEADVRFTTRYLIDKVPKLEPVNLRIQYTDIEWDQETDQIISIAVYDNYLDKVVAFVWKPNLRPDVVQETYTFPKSGYQFQATIHLYNSKGSMLKGYLDFVKETDPDVLTGWYFIKYDMPGIINSVNSIRGLSSASLSPIGKCYISKEKRYYKDDVVCKGRVIWDTLKAYDNLQPTGLPDASLEAIAEKELGEGKHPLTKPIPWLWRNDLKTLVEYNCKDAVLVYRIDNKCKVTDYYDSLRRWVGCEWENVFSGTQMWDTYILRKVQGKVILPTKKQIVIERIKGAEVFIPQKGIHEWIVLIDLKSLYPSNIVTFNMSPERIVRDNSVNTDKLGKHRIYHLPNGVSFYAKPIGLFPSILLEVDAEREKYKAEMKKYPFGTSEYDVYFHLSEGIKVHKNKLYGATLYKKFRLAEREIGKSITFVGRKVIIWCRQHIIDFGLKVLYGDTDSIFYISNKDNLEEVIQEMNAVIKSINEGVKDLVEELGGDRNNCYIKIEPKKIYKYFLIAKLKSGERGAKKRYAGRVVWAEGKEVDEVDIMGFEFRRSNSSRLSRELQKKIFKVLFGYEPRDQLREYVKQAKRILEGVGIMPDYEYFGIPQSITKPFNKYKQDNPWRRGAMWSNEYLGLNFTVGDKPKVIYVRRVPSSYPKTDVVCFRNNQDLLNLIGLEVDVEKMFQKSVVMKLEQILDAANISIEEIIYGQTSLEQY